MRDNISPEGRLLALIRKARPKKAEDKAVGNHTENRNTERNRFRISFSKGAFSGTDILKHVNKYLVFLVVILALFLIVDIAITNPQKKMTLLLSGVVEKSSDVGYKKEDPAGRTEDFSEYSGHISARKIFGPPPAQVTQETGKPAEEIFGNLNLVGIIAGAEPQAIIEDKKSQKTHYLNKGQSFDGITVEEISEDKVKLNSGGRRTTLVL